MTSVLVTGAAGLIGRSVVRELERAGHDVFSVYRSADAVAPNASARAVFVDLASPAASAQLPPCDAVVHCAAVLPRVFEGPEAEAVARANRALDDAMLEYRERARSLMVFLSSSAVYGRTGAPWSEQSPAAPLGPYAREKLRTESLLAGGNLPWTALRVSAPYGPGQRVRTVMSLFVERAVAGADLLVHGSGARQQDFTEARDVAGAVVCAVLKRATAGVVNVSGGEPISMRGLAELVVAAVPGTASSVRLSGQPDPDEDYRAALVLEKGRRELDWTPRIPLAAGIADMVAARKAAA